jgi:hypothetical protein
MKPTLKAHGTKRLKLKFDILLSNFAFKFNLRRYTTDAIQAIFKARGTVLPVVVIGRPVQVQVDRA